MSSVVVHLPAGHLRWRRLRDQPLLAGLPYHLLTLLLDPNREGEAEWTQEAVARRLHVSVHAVKKAFARLKTCGYYLPRRRPVGRARVLHWWFVTDEPGEFGEVDKRISRDYSAAVDATTDAAESASPLAESEVDQQPLKSDPEPPVVAPTVGKAFPPTPSVDKSSTPPVDNLRGVRRRALTRRRLVTPELPEPLQPWAAAAVRLAHDLTIPAGSWRVEVAGYLAVALRAGETEQDLLRMMSANLAGVVSIPSVIRWRARGFARQLHAQLADEVYTGRYDKARKTA